MCSVMEYFLVKMIVFQNSYCFYLVIWLIQMPSFYLFHNQVEKYKIWTKYEIVTEQIKSLNKISICKKLEKKSVELPTNVCYILMSSSLTILEWNVNNFFCNKTWEKKKWKQVKRECKFIWPGILREFKYHNRNNLNITTFEMCRVIEFYLVLVCARNKWI